MEEFACRCCGQLPPYTKENVEALVTVVLYRRTGVNRNMVLWG